MEAYYFGTNGKITRLTVQLEEVPPSVNHVWKSHIAGRRAITYLTKEGKDFKKRLAAKVPKEWKPYHEEVDVLIELVFPDKRRRDIDNYGKAILDALNQKAYLDDSQIVKLTLTKKFKKNKPLIRVHVVPHVDMKTTSSAEGLKYGY